MSARLWRRRWLLAEIRYRGGRITTGETQGLYRGYGLPSRTTARSDLKALVRYGHLTPRGPDNGLYFQLSSKEAL